MYKGFLFYFLFTLTLILIPDRNCSQKRVQQHLKQKHGFILNLHTITLKFAHTSLLKCISLWFYSQCSVCLLAFTCRLINLHWEQEAHELYHYTTIKPRALIIINTARLKIDVNMYSSCFTKFTASHNSEFVSYSKLLRTHLLPENWQFPSECCVSDNTV